MKTDKFQLKLWRVNLQPGKFKLFLMRLKHHQTLLSKYSYKNSPHVKSFSINLKLPRGARLTNSPEKDIFKASWSTSLLHSGFSWYFWKPQEANVEVCWQRSCRIAAKWYETCRHFNVRAQKKSAKKESDYRRSESHKSEGGARKEIDTSIDCMSLTNSHLSLMSGSWDILGTVQQRRLL